MRSEEPEKIDKEIIEISANRTSSEKKRDYVPISASSLFF
jgi:hypothetical protein